MDMKEKKEGSCLIFQVGSSIYGIDSVKVIELIWLPELTALENSPRYVVGHFNFRGTFVPVIDLNLRQGAKTRKYRTNDRVLVLISGNEKIGIHIHDVLNVIHLHSEDMKSEEGPQGIISSVIQTEHGITQILDADSILGKEEAVSREKSRFSESVLSRIFADLTEDERAVLLKRKDNYSRESKIREYSNLLSTALIRLDDEYLGIELRSILEFISAESVSIIPCVPVHIAGCVNLRGDILILLDLLYLIKQKKTKLSSSNKIVVVRQNGLVLGLIVDQLLDVVYLSREQMMKTPSEMKSREGFDFIRSTCLVEGRMTGILDLEKIFSYEKLYVEESVK